MTVVYLTGGAKNGKSALAQNLAVEFSRRSGWPLFYLATMIPCDGEDRARVERHCRERAGLGFITLEEGRLVAPLARAEGVFLLDSVTALLANVMFPPQGPPDPQAAEKVAHDLLEFVARAGCAVLVSDSIGGDGCTYDAWTETYQRGLAAVDRQLAAVCDVVAEMTAGLPLIYKGSLDL